MEKNEQSEKEIKFIIEKSEEDLECYTLINEFNKRLLNIDFILKSHSKKTNSDDYYDTSDFELLAMHNTLRIRTTTIGDINKIKGTFKAPKESSNSAYLDRIEIEEKLEDNKFIFLMDMLDDKVNFEDLEINPTPVINITNKRIDIIYKKVNSAVCVSFDKCIYKNLISGKEEKDRMVEIEAVGIIDDKDMESIYIALKDISGLSINKQSKYERAIEFTTKKENKIIKA